MHVTLTGKGLSRTQTMGCFCPLLLQLYHVMHANTQPKNT